MAAHYISQKAEGNPLVRDLFIWAAEDVYGLNLWEAFPLHTEEHMKLQLERGFLQQSLA